MARRRRQDSGLEGVLLVDKPVGPTSFDIVAKLRRALNTRAIGHTGTLDPLASGLLVILVGRYTRLSQYLTAQDKAYLADITFGFSTTTDDKEGEVALEGDPSGLDPAQVETALARMEGPCRQTPPVYSAISVEGERLYMKARRGEEVEVPARDVVLERLALTGWTAPTASVEVRCSKGTYVRAIARDLGSALGVPAHLSGLRRTASGAYDLEEAAPLDALLEEGAAAAALKTGPDAIRGLPTLDVDDRGATNLRAGRKVKRAGGAGGVHLAVHGAELVALVEGDAAHWRVVRGFGAPPAPAPAAG